MVKSTGVSLNRADGTVRISFLPDARDVEASPGETEVEVNQCPPWKICGKTGVYQLYEVVRRKPHSS
jgi:hypothetical protein